MREYSYGIIPLRFRKGQWEVLLIQHHAGHWAFPKGHAEVGENPKQTAERELDEETGLKVQKYLVDEPLIETYIFSLQSQKIFKTVTYFLAKVKGRVFLQEGEIANSRWVALDQAAECMTFPAGKELCRKVQQLMAKS